MKPTDQTTAQDPAEEPIPMTTTVFNPAPMKADEHDWRQHGYMIHDNCIPSRPECHNGAIPIGPGNLLIRDANGNYRIEKEADLTIPERQQRPAN